MRGIRNTVTLRSLRKKSNSDDEMEDVEESINAMDMELDTDAMESMGSAKKGKGCKVLNPKSSGFKAEDHESWSKKRFLTTSEVKPTSFLNINALIACNLSVHFQLAFNLVTKICCVIRALMDLTHWSVNVGCARGAAFILLLMSDCGSLLCRSENTSP